MDYSPWGRKERPGVLCSKQRCQNCPKGIKEGIPFFVSHPSGLVALGSESPASG